MTEKYILELSNYGEECNNIITLNNKYVSMFHVYQVFKIKLREPVKVEKKSVEISTLFLRGGGIRGHFHTFQFRLRMA